MTQAGQERTRTRSGGRSAEVRRAVGEATLNLLARGRVDFTMVEVAEAAGVGRRTLYRWWPTQTDLLIEALDRHVRHVPTAVSTGDWSTDLRSLAHALAAFAADPVELAIATIMAGRRHPEFNALVARGWEPAIASWHALYESAAAAGQAAPGHDPETVFNTLLGPVFLGPLMLGRAIAPDQVDRVVDLMLAATAAPPEPPAPNLG